MHIKDSAIKRMQKRRLSNVLSISEIRFVDAMLSTAHEPSELLLLQTSKFINKKWMDFIYHVKAE